MNNYLLATIKANFAKLEENKKLASDKEFNFSKNFTNFPPYLHVSHLDSQNSSRDLMKSKIVQTSFQNLIFSWRLFI